MEEIRLLQDVPTPIVRAVNAAANLSDREVAARLLNLLGATLTAAIGGTTDTRTARGWAKGRECPRVEALRSALLAAIAVATSYGEESARAWFTSANPNLDRAAPLVFVRSATNPGQFNRLLDVAVGDAG